MSKALINTINTTSQTVNAGSGVNLGSITRRCGCGIQLLNSNIITLSQAGYYTITAESVLVGSAGNVIIDIVQDGNVIGQGEITTTTDDYHTITIIATARVTCGQVSNISIVVDSASSATPTISREQVRILR